MTDVLYIEVSTFLCTMNHSDKSDEKCERFWTIKHLVGPASWSSGQSFWLLIIKSRVRFPVLTWGFFLGGEDSHADYGHGSLVELRFKAPPGTSYSYMTIHLIGTIYLCLMSVPSSEVSYTSATAGRGDHEVHKGHMVALGGRREGISWISSAACAKFYNSLKFLIYLNCCAFQREIYFQTLHFVKLKWLQTVMWMDTAYDMSLSLGYERQSTEWFMAWYWKVSLTEHKWSTTHFPFQISRWNTQYNHVWLCECLR
jgi:hypothetical protein